MINSWNWLNNHFPNIETIDSTGDYEETSITEQTLKALGVK